MVTKSFDYISISTNLQQCYLTLAHYADNDNEK